VLDEQETAVHELFRNTGRVFAAINEREGALRELIVNSNNTFEATASRDDALAETFEVFPVFLDESKATLARLEDFSRDTRPLVNDLKGPADDLGPTVRDLGDLAPDLENLFRDLPPLIAASRRGVPGMERVLKEAEPLFEQLHPFFQELNPILSYFNFHQATLAGFISNAAPDLSGQYGGDRYQVNVGIIESTGFQRHMTRPDSERGNAYMQPNALQRAIALGTIESFDCTPSGGERVNAEDAEGSDPFRKDGMKRPPCLVAPPSMFNGKQFVGLESGEAPNRSAPGFREGNKPATDPNPGDPLD
jgi:ABC-type transporter Mla subunit MlaD